jgi:N-acetylglucosaminyldiphosphoundecaprenol N-acetyl-beta-D-mannosaminyltransferase
MHGVGGAFDVMAGLTKRAPVAWQKAGMEWAFRLLQEPRRLWWRYMATNTSFIHLTARELLHPSRAFASERTQDQTPFDRKRAPAAEQRT